MNQLWQLYGFEIKKIMKNRLTIAMLIVTVLFLLIEAFTPKLYLTEEMRDEQKVLDGRIIDDALLREMAPKLVDNGTVWTDDNAPYERIAEIERGMLPENADLADCSAEEMYRERDEAIVAMMKRDQLTEGELQWWERERAKTRTPFLYRDCQGTVNLSQGMSLTLMCIMLISALCLSTVFTMEHRQRTDQLLISCRHGRGETYFVKTAAGLTVVTVCCLISAALLTILIAVLYGLDGLDAVVQLELPLSAYSFTMGRFILIQMLVMLTASVLFASFAMAMSEIIKNSLAVMGIMVGIFVFSQLELIPPQYRVLAQMKSMLPSNQISIWSLLEHRLVGTGGVYVTTYAASPVIYLLLSALLILAGKTAYDRFRVTGR